ncbi:MAG: hypothetical protein HC801_09040 [Nitrospira sp.]|nr:hypothetical protein [Nitrospira sp.]
MSEATRDVPAFRVTFFFGPEPVEGKTDAVVCVFNVKNGVGGQAFRSR